MAGGIKGITVKIGGDTTELGKSLTEVSKKSSDLQRELKGVNTLLKMDPTNVTLLKQKEDLLNDSIAETKKKLDNLVEVQKKVDAGEVEMTEAEYRNLQREIESTQIKLKSLTDQQKEFGSVGAQKVAAYGEKVKETGESVEKAGQKMMPATVAITGLGTAAVVATANFDQAMSNVSAISGATGDDLEALRAKAKEMGEQTKFSATESAEAFSYMAMAGWETEDMLDGIEGIMNLAAASGEDLATTSDIVTDALTAFGLAAEDSGHFADVLAQASSSANTNVSMMGETFKYVAPVAGALGYSADDTAVAIGLMANAGIKGSQAGTALRTSLTNLASPAKSASDAMHALGFYATEAVSTMDQAAIDKQMIKIEKATLAVTTAEEKYNATVEKNGEESSEAAIALEKLNIKKSELAQKEAELTELQQGETDEIDLYNAAIQNEDGSMRSLRDTMSYLREKFKDLDESEQAAYASAIFGKEAMSGMLAIINASDEDFDHLIEQIDTCDGSAQNMADTMNDNLTGQITILKSQLESLAISFGELLVPVIRKVVEWLQGLLDKLNGMSDTQRKVILVIAAIVAAIGPLLIVIGNLMQAVGTVMTWAPKITSMLSSVGTSIGAIAGPVGAAVAVIAVLTAAFITLWNTSEEFRDTISGILERLKSAFSQFGDRIVEILNKLGIECSSFTEGLKAIWEIYCEWMAPFIEGAFNQVCTIIEAVLDVITGVLNVFIGLFTGDWEMMWEGIKQIVEGIWTLIKGTIESYLLVIKGVIDNFLNLFGSSWSAFWGGIKNVISAIWNDIKIIFTTAMDAIRNTAASILEAVKGVFSTAWEAIKTLVSSAINAIHSVISGVLEKIKSSLSSAWGKIQSAASTAWNKIKDAILSPLEKAKEKIDSTVEKIKDTVKNIFKGIKPKLDISLPKVTVSGGSAPWGIGGWGELPEFSVKWNAAGAIFDKPTIFGTRLGFQGLGEDGAEAVAPITELMKYVETAVDNGMLAERMDRLESVIAKGFAKMNLNQKIVLDTGVLVGETIDKIDEALNDNNMLRERGA